MKEIPIDLQHITLMNFSLFIFAVVLTITLANAISALLKNTLENRINKSLIKWIAKLSTYLTYVIGFYISFTKIIHFNLPAALAALGVFGAFCFVPTIPVLQNVIAGIFIAFTRPFKEGEFVDIGGEICEVIDIMILKTKAKGISGKVIFVPNISLITGNVSNYSRGKFLRLDLSFDLKNNVEFETIEDILLSICKESPDILPSVKVQTLNRLQRYFMERTNLDNYMPKCFIKNLGKDKFTIGLSFWILNIQLKDQIIHYVNKQVINHTKENNIEFA